jgi:hypothetical protein
VLHKLAPALAAGNAVGLKPARTTPLTALELAVCFVDAGLPEGVLSVLTGPGGTLATRWSATRACGRSPSPARPPPASASPAWLSSVGIDGTAEGDERKAGEASLREE